MGLTENPFIGLPLATLQQMQTQWLQVLTDIASVGQSYTFPNRSLTKADLPQVLQILTYLRWALASAFGGTGAVQVAQAYIDTQTKFYVGNSV